MWWWKSFLREATYSYLEFHAWLDYKDDLYEECCFEEYANIDLYTISLMVFVRLDRFKCLLPEHPFPEIPRYLLFWERVVAHMEPTLPAAFDEIYHDATFNFAKTRHFGVMGKVVEHPDARTTCESRLVIESGSLVIKQYIGRTVVKILRDPPLPYKVTTPVSFVGVRRHLGDTVLYIY